MTLYSAFTIVAYGRQNSCRPHWVNLRAADGAYRKLEHRSNGKRKKVLAEEKNKRGSCAGNLQPTHLPCRAVSCSTLSHYQKPCQHDFLAIPEQFEGSAAPGGVNFTHNACGSRTGVFEEHAPVNQAAGSHAGGRSCRPPGGEDEARPNLPALTAGTPRFPSLSPARSQLLQAPRRPPPGLLLANG